MSKKVSNLVDKLDARKKLEALGDQVLKHPCLLCLDKAQAVGRVEFIPEGESTLQQIFFPLCVKCTQLGMDVCARRIANEHKKGSINWQ